MICLDYMQKLSLKGITLFDLKLRDIKQIAVFN